MLITEAEGVQERKMKETEAENCSVCGEIRTLMDGSESGIPRRSNLRKNGVPRSKRPLARPYINDEFLPSIQLAEIVSAAEGVIKIDFPANVNGPCPARSTVRLRNLHEKVLVVILPDGEPIIVGQVYDSPRVGEGEEDANVVIKGRRVRIETGIELVLVAGSSKIHLDSRGKVVTSADQIVSRARSTNKIQGGNVQIN
jgi:hypothetical protein